MTAFVNVVNELVVSSENTKLFDNEAFNLDLRELYLDYLHKLLATYTDKRGTDYQDIKRFFTRTLTELKFLPEKEAKALFVTKRKKKSA